MKRRFLSFGIALVFCFSFLSTSVFAQGGFQSNAGGSGSSNITTYTAKLSKHKVTFDGKEIEIRPYVIDGDYYFKLRDIAALLSETPKSFNVKYNSAMKSIELMSKQKYTKIKGDLSKIANEDSIRVDEIETPLLIDGNSIELTAFNINGNMYYRLLDLAYYLDFDIGMESDSRTIQIFSGEKPKRDLSKLNPQSRKLVEAMDYITWREEGFSGYLNAEYDEKGPSPSLYPTTFYEGLAFMYEHRKDYQFINEDGEIAFPGNYERVWSYSEGLAAVTPESEDGYIFIDKTGKQAFQGTFDKVRWFKEGRAQVEKDKKKFYIDKTGKKVFEFEGDGDDFNEGWAGTWVDDKIIFYDKMGKKVLKLNYDIFGLRKEDMILVAKKNGKNKYGYDNYKYGAVDLTGKEVIALNYDNFRSFTNGLAVVEKDGKWGFIDKTGKEIIKIQYDGAKSFYGKYAPVKKGELWGYIDQTGKVVIPFKYDWAAAFHEGFAAVEIEGYYSYIDMDGNELLEFGKYNYAGLINGGLAVLSKTDPYTWGVLNINISEQKKKEKDRVKDGLEMFEKEKEKEETEDNDSESNKERYFN